MNNPHPKGEAFRSLMSGNALNILSLVIASSVAVGGAVSVTETRKALQAIQNDEQTDFVILSMIAKSQEVAAFQVDSEHRVSWCNSLATLQFGVVKGDDISKIMPPAEAREHKRTFGEAMAEHKRGAKIAKTFYCQAVTIDGVKPVKVEMWTTASGASACVTILDKGEGDEGGDRE